MSSFCFAFLSEALSLSKTVKKIKISCRPYPRTYRVCAIIILPIRTVYLVCWLFGPP